MKIGYLNDNYPEQRTILNKVKQVKYKKISKANNIYNYIQVANNKILKSKSINNMFKHKSIFVNNIDLYHFFNTVTYDKKNYITTFETCVPRIDMLISNFNRHMDLSKFDIEKELKFLTNRNCKQLIALSECSKEIQLSILKKCSQETKRAIEKK